MRIRTGPENTILAAAQKAVAAVKVEIKDAGGVYQDWFSHLLSLSWGASVDQPIAEVRLNLKRDSGLENSLSPFRSDSTFNVGGTAIDAGRDIRISPATTAWGVSPVSGDYKRLFEGKTADIDFANASMEVIARDLGGALVQKQVKETSEFRSEAGEPLEDVIQDLLDTWAPGIALYTPVSPGFMVTSIDWGKGSVFDAIRTAAGKIGWDIRYLWDNGTSTFRLTLFEPDRTKTVPDWTIASHRYFRITQLAIRSEFVRNYIEVSYPDEDTGQHETVFASDPVSIERFDEQWMQIEEPDNSPITTAEEAQALADAALSDLAWPIADKQVEMPFFWPVELGDLIRFTANGVHADEDIDLAVIAYQHHLDRTSARTTLTLRGKPAGFYRNWLKAAKEEVDTIAEELGLSVVIRETSRTDTHITYAITWGDGVTSIWIYDRLRENPPPENPWPGPDELPDTILSDGETEYTVEIPPSGFLRYVLFEPRDATLAVGTLEHVIVAPSIEAPDQIVSLEVVVNDEDGSAIVKVFAVDRTLSYRYAYALGTVASPPTGPTDAEVEAGTDRLITGGDSFVLPAGTVAWNQVLRVRAAPYINANGTGTTGPGDHGEIRSAEDVRLKPPVELDVTHEEEVGALGIFGVTVRDGSGVSTGLFYRKKTGPNAFGAWTPKAEPPTDGVEYQETVALMEGHPSRIEFRLDYVFNGMPLQLPVKSIEFDLGQIPNGFIKPVLDENNDTASADLTGDSDTNSWKVAAAVGAMPSDATVRATTAINGRVLRASVVGALVTGLTLGQTVYFKAFGYSAAGGTGNESSAAFTAEAIYKVVPPKLEQATVVEVGTDGTFGVIVRDPTGQADALYYSTRVGTDDWGAWILKAASPTDNTEYQETVALIEGHLSYVRFRLNYVIAGDPREEKETSPGFDLGQIPNGTIIPFVSQSGVAGAVLQGDSDTLSWKVLASTSGYPTDAAVRASAAINGRTPIASSLLTGVPLGTKIYYKGFGYSQIGGGGDESSAAILAETDRESAMTPKVKEEVTRSGTTATITITIRDEQLRITGISYTKREGETSTGATAWTGGTGTIGSSQDLVRSHSLSVPDGKDSEFNYLITYTDEMGVSRTIGKPITISNLQTLTKSIRIPWSEFIGQVATNFQYVGTHMEPAVINTVLTAYASVVMPKGVTITGFTARTYRHTVSDNSGTTLMRVHADNSTTTGVASVGHSSTGWTNDSSSGHSELVGDDTYVVFWVANGVANVTNARMGWVEITYSVPSYAKTY